jgi:hypothetical protein
LISEIKCKTSFAHSSSQDESPRHKKEIINGITFQTDKKAKNIYNEKRTNIHEQEKNPRNNVKRPLQNHSALLSKPEKNVT